MNNDYKGYPKLKGWSKLFFYNNLMDKQYRKIFNGIDLKNKKILEIGFGSGSLLKWLTSVDAEVYGVEIQKELVETARENGIEAYDNLSLFRTRKFDVIIGFDVLEHLSKDEIENIFFDIKNMIAENGICIFRFPNCQSPAGLLTQNADHTHETQLSLPIMKYYFEKNKLVAFHMMEGKSESYYKRNRLINFLIDQYRKILRFQLGIALGSTSIPLYSDIIVFVKKIK